METIKDLYRVLNISPSATTEDIKKAFRKLALQYHPDKHGNSFTATEKFTAIQEAYYILSDRKRRAEYNYRRYLQNPVYANRPIANTPEDIFQLSKKIHKEIALIDPFRMDRDLLYFHLMELLSDDHVTILTNTGNVLINREIVTLVTASFHHVSLHNVEMIAEKLKMLVGNDVVAKKELQQSISEAKQYYYWNKYKFLIALLAALIVCFFIYITKR